MLSFGYAYALSLVFWLFKAFVRRFYFSSGTCSTFFPLCLPPRGSRSGVSESQEWVALLGVPFGEGLSLDCGSSSSSGFLLPSSFLSQTLVSGIKGFFVVREEFLSSTVPSAQFWKLLLVYSVVVAPGYGWSTPDVDSSANSRSREVSFS